MAAVNDHAGIWHLTNLSASSPSPELQAALQLHATWSGSGLTLVVVAVDGATRHYLVQAPCPGCATGRCAMGCRVQLLRRAFAAHVPSVTLRPVALGLAPRPYTRALALSPSADAQPLPAVLLHNWAEARLLVTWRGGPKQGLRWGATLFVGATGPDPRPILNPYGWRGKAIRVGRAEGVRAIKGWHCQPTTHAPDLLVAAPSSPLSPDRPVLPSHDVGQPAMVAALVAACGGRVEQLDWVARKGTATVVLTAADGGDVAPVWEALAEQSGVKVQQAAATVQLADDMPALVLPPAPLAFLGTHTATKAQRFRPLTSTHHLILAGHDLGPVVAGVFAPTLLNGLLRTVVLDVTEGGGWAQALVDLPQRLATSDSGSVAEVLRAIGSVPSDQLVVAVVHATDAAACRAAVVPLLRAAQQRALAVILAVPELVVVPEVLRLRLPILQVVTDTARWTDPHGEWSWADTAVLRVPWRDVTAPWPTVPALPEAPSRPADVFWDAPLDLRHALGLPAERDADAPLPPPPAPAPTVPRRARIYAVAPQAVPWQRTPMSLNESDEIVLTDAFVARVLWWAAGHVQPDGSNVGEMYRGLELPRRALLDPLRSALAARGVLTATTRTGWVRLLSVEEAVVPRRGGGNAMKAATTVRRTQTAPLPAHPLLKRWVWGCVNLLLVELAYCAPLAGRGLLRLMPELALAVAPYERWLPWLDWACWGVGMAILLATWIQLALVFVLLWCWGYTVEHVTGTYHAVILPKPTGRVSSAVPTSQGAPLWERIVAAIEHAPAPAYLATELWGDASGRVGWGVWLPDALVAERPTLQRLVTAERPQARLATAPDPLSQALEADGAGWYAGATLELAAFDQYPLKADPLALPTLAAALRPQGGVIACGVSLIVRPTPRSWSRAVRIKAQRRVAKVRRLGDRQQTALAEVIQTKAVQPAARTLIRVHVIAATRALAEAERGTLIQTLMANEGRYTQYLTQRWRVTEQIVVKIGAKGVSRPWCVRAPRCPLPLLWPLVPLI